MSDALVKFFHFFILHNLRDSINLGLDPFVGKSTCVLISPSYGDPGVGAFKEHAQIRGCHGLPSCSSGRGLALWDPISCHLGGLLPQQVSWGGPGLHLMEDVSVDASTPSCAKASYSCSK